MNKWKTLLTSPLWILFWGRNYRNAFRYSLVFLTNLFAACLEGVSYAFILIAFSVISKNQVIDFSSYKLLLKFHINDFLAQLSQIQMFAGFIILAIGLQVIRSGLSFCTSYYSIIISYKLLKRAQIKIYKQIFRMTYSFVNRYKMGDLVEYIRTPANYFGTLMDHLNKCILHSIMVLICFGMMLWLEWRLTLITFFLYGIFFLLQRNVLKKISVVSKDQTNEFAEFNKHIVQNMQSIRTLHIYNQQNNALKKIRTIFLAIAKSTKKINLWHGSIPALNEIFGIVLVGSVLVSGVIIFHNETQSPLSILLTFLILAYRMSAKFQAVIGNIATISYHFGSVHRLNDILKTSNKEFSVRSGKPLKVIKNCIEFDNVTFTYSEKTPPAVSNVSFKIECSMTTALVGLSGSGKSTLLDLLVRLYDPTYGQILVDGTMINTYHIESWRNLFGVVCQDICLLNETVEENILFGYQPKRKDAVISAARIAGAHEFIQQLPKGYQTIIGERGHRLSGGEKQRLSLARAIIRDPKILILDEATSHLDSHSEAQFQNSLKKFSQNRTIIVVAHRLSTIVNADKIIVLECGAIIEQGNHHSLLTLNQRYASLWDKQRSTDKINQKLAPSHL